MSFSPKVSYANANADAALHFPSLLPISCAIRYCSRRYGMLGTVSPRRNKMVPILPLASPSAVLSKHRLAAPKHSWYISKALSWWPALSSFRASTVYTLYSSTLDLATSSSTSYCLAISSCRSWYRRANA